MPAVPGGVRAAVLGAHAPARAVVGGDDVDRPVGETRPERVAVLAARAAAG